MKRPFDGKALGEQIVSFVRSFVAKHVDALKERVDGIEAAVKAIPAPMKGDPGPSVYDIAVENGFAGNHAEWLESLKGQKGDPGESIKGDPGTDGKHGSSIYSGEGAPDASLGKSGDHYIDLLTGDVYRCD